MDEYDTPAHEAFVGGYYNTFISFLRNWLSAGLKDNSYLEFGVLTGILRVAKESIFSGLNNVSTFTILNEAFQDKFGLLESEVVLLLKEYDLLDKLPEIRNWYNGYRIGSADGIYNPWSVLNCIESKGALVPFWVNTSDNALVAQFVTKGSDELKIDLEELVKGNAIEKTIEEGIVFSNLEKDPDAIWSILLFSGYLTIARTFTFGTPCLLKIPNTEVGELYRSIILNWFKQSIHEKKYHLLLNSLTTGDIDTFAELFEEFVFSTFSTFDVTQEQPERVYHAFVLGMLIGLQGTYEVKSNRESGLGRYDVILFPKNPNDLGIIMEFKKVKPETIDLETAAMSAINQIEERQYAQELQDRGVRHCLLLGLAFVGKKVLIRAKRRVMGA
jgi:hypothetical protein